MLPRTALDLALSKGRTRIADLILNSRRPGAEWNWNATVLHTLGGLFLRKGHYAAFEYLLNTGHFRPNEIFVNGLALPAALVNLYQPKHLELLLLRNRGGIDLNWAKPITKETALHFAGGWRPIEMMELLMKYGGDDLDVNPVDWNGHTPLTKEVLGVSEY